MSEIMLMTMIKKSIITGAIIAAPVLLTSLLIGLTISILQATTQIQEQTLPFTFKLAGIGIIFLIGGNWIFNKLITLSTELFSYIANITG
jgi:flagellar biosynthetic protein FliQ